MALTNKEIKRLKGVSSELGVVMQYYKDLKAKERPPVSMDEHIWQSISENVLELMAASEMESPHDRP